MQQRSHLDSPGLFVLRVDLGGRQPAPLTADSAEKLPQKLPLLSSNSSGCLAFRTVALHAPLLVARPPVAATVSACGMMAGSLMSLVSKLS